MDEKQFYAYIYNLAKQKGAKFPELVAGHAVLESNSGKSGIGNGKFNVFGQTALPSDKNSVRIGNKNFKSYRSYDEAVAHHVKKWGKYHVGKQNAGQALLSYINKYAPKGDSNGQHSNGNGNYNYESSMSNILKRNGSSINIKSNMPSIKDNNSPAYAQAQNLSEADKNKIIQQYKIQSRILKGKALQDYNDQMWRQGYIGFDEAGNATGFVAEGIRSQMTKNQKKEDLQVKQKNEALKAISSYLKNNSKYEQQSQSASYAKESVSTNSLTKLVLNKNSNDLNKISSLINKMAKEDPYNNEARIILNDFFKKANSSNESERNEAFIEADKYFKKYGGKNLDLYKKTKSGEILPGKDLDYSDGYMRVSTANKTGLNFENPMVSSKNVGDIVLPNFNPALKPEVDTIDGIDNTSDSNMFSIPTIESSTLPALTTLEYQKMNPDTSAADDKANRDYNNKLAEQGKVASDKASAERAGMTEEQVAEQERQNRIDFSLRQFNIETPETNNRYDADPSTFKSRLPLAELASGAIGIALGKSIMDEEQVWRDEELNNSLMSHIYEQRRISEMGMNPTEEAAAKEAIANSYQIGYQNIVNNSSGNRALILGNLANLDNISSKRMSEIALKDVEIKQRASEEYGRAMEYVQQFNTAKSIANNERKYQQAVLRSSQGTAVLAGAFKSMSEALGSYRAPNSAENMYMIHAQVANMGWSPLVKDDGEGTNKWSYSWYQKQTEKNTETRAEEEIVRNKFNSLPQKEKEAFAEKTYGMGRGQQYRMARSMFENEGTPQSQETVLDENRNVISTQPADQNGATVPIGKTIIQSANGDQTLATPMSKTTPDGTSASVPQSANEPIGISSQKNTMFDRLKPEPIKVENIRTSDGRSLNLQKNIRPETKFGIAQNDYDPNEIYAETLGLDNLYADAKEINRYYNQFGENEYERSTNIRNALNNTI